MTALNAFINYSFDESSFLEIDIQDSRSKGRPQNWPKELDKLYVKKLSISAQKKDDLVNLCRKGIIPEEFQSYFIGLPVDKKSKDRIPLPAVDEDSEDTDQE